MRIKLGSGERTQERELPKRPCLELAPAAIQDPGATLALDGLTRDLAPNTYRILKEQNESVIANAASLVDNTTGVWTRAAFQRWQENPAKFCAMTGYNYFDPRDTQSTFYIATDVVGLKLYNDTVSHSRGDELLAATAALLYELASGYEGIVARYGGDEFVIAVPANKVNPSTLQVEMNEVRRLLTEHFPQGSIRAGIATDLSTADGIERVIGAILKYDIKKVRNTISPNSMCLTLEGLSSRLASVDAHLCSTVGDHALRAFRKGKFLPGKEGELLTNVRHR